MPREIEFTLRTAQVWELLNDIINTKFPHFLKNMGVHFNNFHKDVGKEATRASRNDVAIEGIVITGMMLVIALSLLKNIKVMMLIVKTIWREVLKNLKWRIDRKYDLAFVRLIYFACFNSLVAFIVLVMLSISQ